MHVHFHGILFQKTIHIGMLLKSKEIVRENTGARKQNIIL